jgi:hypothetical protein
VKRYLNNSPTSRVIGNALDQHNYVLVQNIINPKDKDPSLFDKNPQFWEPYIAANLYMYIVPLAIFLRRSREFDFSSRRYDKSIQTVKRVFRVFSPSLIQVIVRLLDGQNNPSSKYRDIVALHECNLGPYGPPSSTSGVKFSYSLSSCKGDMQSLMEEIDTQHNKKVSELDVVDRIFSWVEGWFGKGVISGEEKVLDKLMERAKLIVNLPMDYEFIQQSKPTSKIAGSSSSNANDNDDMYRFRNPDGTLTDYGRQQLLTGQWKCTTDDIITLQDPMRAEVRSYEISVLVVLTVMLSDYLNEQLKLDGGGHHQHEQRHQQKYFRINLRFLADYRNILFIGLILFVWKPQWILRLFVLVRTN